MSEVSLFEYDESGNVIYNPSESEVLENGDDSVSSDQVGDLVEIEEDVSTYDLEIEAETSESDLLVSGDSSSAVLLSEDISLIADAVAPAGGSIGSSTLSYYDRIVSGFPSDYKYIAYNTNNDNSYDAILYYSDDYDIDSSSITFNTGKSLEVVRSSGSSYNYVTYYYENDINNITIPFSIDGNVVYYTNSEIGYPLLGGYAPPMSYSPFIIGALLCGVLTAIFTKLLRR